MGDQSVNTRIDLTSRSEFLRHLLNDIEALQIMLDKNMIEDDITRIGAEQEFCTVTNDWRPSPYADQILSAINDEHFTTELARYNLEINLDPLELKEDCFNVMENRLRDFLNLAYDKAAEYDSKVVLTGILPSISKKELEFEYLTPRPRYWALNDMMKAVRGTDFQVHIMGVDELKVAHESVLFEAANTSFQMHLQIHPDDFISSYNWSQAITGPVLAISTNSPIFLGRELWSETRIALFRQSIDIRNTSHALKERQARVTFGDSWAWGSSIDIFKNEIARHQVILIKDIEKDSLDELEKGNIPKLEAMNLLNGTIWRWNRACYGVGGGKPHLRIECRYIPSGPSIVDEMANFAFWVGLMKGRPAKYNDMENQMDFRNAQSNFLKASRYGKETMMWWDDRERNVQELVTKEFIPMAYAGLESVGVNKDDIEKYMKIIDQRALGQTGSQWIVRNYRNLKNDLRADDALLSLTKTLHENQFNPVNEWDDIEKPESTFKNSYLVSHIMSTKLFSVYENDLADLATKVMQWRDIHHMPVLNSKDQLSGLLTMSRVKKYWKEDEEHMNVTVADIMERNVYAVNPDTEIKDAIKIMKKNEYGCLPVTVENQVVGIITIKDVKDFDDDGSD